MQSGEAKVISKSGASSSRVPPFDQIPREALIRLAERYKLGESKYGRDNWRKGLGDLDYVRERISHIINHAYRALDKLDGKILNDEDDDAAAIMWGGAFLCCVAQKEYPDTPKKHHTTPKL